MEHNNDTISTGYSMVNNLGVIALNLMAWTFNLNNLQTLGSLFLTGLSICFVSFQFYMKVLEYMEQREAKRVAKELENKPKISDHE